MSVALFSQWFRDKDQEGAPPRLWRIGDIELPDPPPLAAMLETAATPLLAFDRHGMVLAASSRAASLFGLPAAHMAGKALGELFEARGVEQLKDIAERAAPLDSNQAIRSYGLHADGHVIPLELTLQAIHDGTETCWTAALADISAEKRLSETLGQCEQRLQRILDALPLGAWLADGNGRPHAHNEAALSLWGLRKGMLPMLGWPGLLLPPGADQPLAEHEKPERLALDSGIPVKNMPLEIVGADGERRHVLYSATPLDIDRGEVLVTLREATELNMLRRTLEQAQELFDTFFLSPASGVVLVLPDERLHAANPSFCAMLGYSEEELSGRKAGELTHPDDRAREQRQIAQLKSGKIDGFQLEKRYRRRDGSYTWGLLSVALLREADGRERYTLHIVQPIDVLKAHEARLEQHEHELTMLTDHNPDAISRFDPNLRCIYANPAFRHLAPMLDAELGTALDDLGLPPQATAEWEMVLQLVLEDEQPRSFEFSLPHGYRQETFLVEVVPEPAGAEHGRAVLAIARDITELKEKEEQLRRHKEDLHASRATVRELAAYHEKVREEERKHIAREIHDELGQRLTALKMETSVAQYHARQQGSEQVGSQLAQLASSIEDMVQLVRNVAANLRPSALNLGIVPAIEWLAEQFRRQHGLRCDVFLPDEELALDDTRVTIVFRIVQESLTNIVRHAHARRVSISLQRHGRNDLRLTIADDGCGFDPSERRKHPTYGLLGISERTLMLGGSLAIAARPGEGTRLTVEFPSHPESAHDSTISD